MAIEDRKNNNDNTFIMHFSNCAVSSAAGILSGALWHVAFTNHNPHAGIFAGAFAAAARNIRPGKLATANIKSAHAEHENHSSSEEHHASSIKHVATDTMITFAAASAETLFAGRFEQVETLKELNKYSHPKAWYANLNFLAQRPTLLIFGQKSIVTLGFFGVFGIIKNRQGAYQKRGYATHVAQIAATIEAAGITSFATHVAQAPLMNAYKSVLNEAKYDEYHRLMTPRPSVNKALVTEFKKSFKAGLFSALRTPSPAAIGGRALVFGVTAATSNCLNEKAQENHGPST